MQSAMSKRVQESTSKEGSGRCGVKELPEHTDNSSARLECFEQPGESMIGSELQHSVRKLMRNSNQDPPACSQERRQDDTLSSTSKKMGRSGE